jgi:hypothetical protein
MTDVAIRRQGQHGANAFSQRTRRKILAALRDRAIGGDPAAAEVLLKYGPATLRASRDPTGPLVAVLRARLDAADGSES